MAQQAFAYTWRGVQRMSKDRYRLSDAPIEEGCSCQACVRYSSGYLCHLLRGKHKLGTRLLSVHNIHHYQQLMRRMREAILAGRFDETYRELKDGYES